MASPTDIRKGRVIVYQGAPHLVLEMLHRTQGRQAGFVQTTRAIYKVDRPLPQSSDPQIMSNSCIPQPRNLNIATKTRKGIILWIWRDLRRHGAC